MMQNVATLIAPADIALDESSLNAFQEVISEQGGVLGKSVWLSQGEACDIFFEGNGLSIKKALTAHATDAGLDAIVQPVAGRRKKALLADMESTLIKEEMLEELADFVGLRTKVEEITTRAMNGELDFKAALQERLLLLKGLSANIVDDLCAKITITPGAKELVKTMQTHGARCIIVSGGFQVFTGYVAKQLGFDEEYGNILDIKDGVITGAMVEPVLDKHSKRAALEATARKLSINESDICAVGDGANDLPMLLAAGLGVAYHAKPVVQAQANNNIRFANLRGLLWAQGYQSSDLKTQ